jgi:hypothetical protein
MHGPKNIKSYSDANKSRAKLATSAIRSPIDMGGVVSGARLLERGD